MDLATYIHLEARLRMKGAIILQPPFMLSWRGQRQFYIFYNHNQGTLFSHEISCHVNLFSYHASYNALYAEDTVIF